MDDSLTMSAAKQTPGLRLEEFLALPPGTKVRLHYSHLMVNTDYEIMEHGVKTSKLKYLDPHLYYPYRDRVFWTDIGLCPYSDGMWNPSNWIEVI